MTEKKTDPFGLAPSLTTELVPLSVKVGWLAPGSGPARLIVDFDGNLNGPLAARMVVTPDAAAIQDAIARKTPVVLMFENGDPRFPIVMGLLQHDQGAELFAALLTPSQPVAPEIPDEARVDGTRVVLEGHEEVTLKCGDASITLRRDGKVIVRGAYVETRATGVNRIKGGSVKIN